MQKSYPTGAKIDVSNVAEAIAYSDDTDFARFPEVRWVNPLH